MGDIAFKVVLLLLALLLSGLIALRLLKGILDGWRLGRLGVHDKRQATGRIIRSAAKPIEFWSMMILWHLMFISSTVVFALSMYGMWHVTFGR
jgi:hypothetical protein